MSVCVCVCVCGGDDGCVQLVHVELHADFVDGSKHTTHRLGQQLVHAIWTVHAKLKVRMYVKGPTGLVFLCANRAADAAKVLAVLQDQKEVPLPVVVLLCGTWTGRIALCLSERSVIFFAVCASMCVCR